VRSYIIEKKATSLIEHRQPKLTLSVSVGNREHVKVPEVYSISGANSLGTESSSTTAEDKKARPSMQGPEMSFFGELGRYFVHGFAFTVMTYASLFILLPALILAAALAAFVGIIVWFGLVLLTWSFVNAVICSYLWDFHVKGDWPSLIIHGLFLIIANTIVSVIMNLISSSVAIGSSILGLVVFYSALWAGSSIVNGMAGKRIGEHSELR
jgi:hypothetical protein